MRGYYFDKLFSVGMNNFHVEGLLPAIFYLIRSGGKQRGKRVYATEINKHVRSFVEHRNVNGFDDKEGLRLADKWIRTSLIRTARVGKGHQKGEQIFFIRPLSFLSYKPGFSSEVSRLRGVPQFLYQIFHDRLGKKWTDLKENIKAAFSEGLILPDGLELNGYYDGQTQLDTEVLASLYYLDTFESRLPSTRTAKKASAPACLENAAEILAKDIYFFVRTYRLRIPPGVLAQYLIALLNFELAIYTLKLVYATNELVRNGSLSGEMALTSRAEGSIPPTDLKFYVDVSGDRHSPSGRMAHASVNRDLEALQEFATARLTLRTLDRYIEDISNIRREVSTLEGSTYLEALLTYHDDADVRASARGELRDIRATLDLEDDVDEDEQLGAAPPELQVILQDDDLDEFSKVLRIIELSHRKQEVTKLVAWYSTGCGIKRDDGLLEGNLRGRRVWRYQMSDLLLEVLVQLCAALPEYNDGQKFPRPVPFVKFLEFLQNRYGILIASPPEWLRSTENIAGAKQNFEALKHRLRQMGLFLDLSDDFNAQRIQPRYTKVEGESD